MATNIVEMIDKVMIEVAKKLPPLILNKIKEIIGSQNNLLKQEVDSIKFTESQFIEIERIIQSVINTINNKLIVEVEKYFRSSMIPMLISEKTKFYNEIKVLTNTFMNFIPTDIRRDVLQAVGSTLDGKTVEDSARQLSSKINLSVAKSINYINETVVRRVREKNYELFSKVSNKDTKWQFVHVKDSKNSPFCKKYGNAIKTEKEWKALKSDIFIEGGHYGCRGVMAIVDLDDGDDYTNEG
jgi:hypothetical protein